MAVFIWAFSIFCVMPSCLLLGVLLGVVPTAPSSVAFGRHTREGDLSTRSSLLKRGQGQKLLATNSLGAILAL